MKVLVYGAGVLGCYLAHTLQRQGNEVVLLARGEWKKEIDNFGLCMLHFGKKNPSIDVMKTVDSLQPSDRYHIIFVTMQYTQLPQIIEALACNESKMIVFLGNNPNPEKIANELNSKSVNRKQLVFGFESVAGQREDHKVEVIHLGKGSLRVGVLDEGRSLWEERLRKVLHKTGVHLSVQENMSSWLRYHGAFVLPIALACYCHEGNLKAVYYDRNLMEDMKKAIAESYNALEKIGFEMDEKDKKFISDFGWKTEAYYKMLMCTPIGKMAVGNHAMNGKEEMMRIAEELERLYQQSGNAMAHYKRLKERALMTLKNE